MKKSEALYSLSLPVTDFLAVFGGFSIAYFIRRKTDLIPFIQTPSEQLPIYSYAARSFMVFGLVLVIYFALGGFYRVNKRLQLRTLSKMLTAALMWWFSIVAYYSIIAHQLYFSRLILIYGAVLTGLLLVVSHISSVLVRTFIHRKEINIHRVLIIGQGNLATRVMRGITKYSGNRIVGVLSDNRNNQWEEKHPDIPYLGIIDDLSHQIHSCDEVIVCEEGLRKERLDEMLELTLEHYKRFRFVPDLFEIHTTNITAEEVSGIPVLELKRTSLEGWGKLIKRIADTLIAVLALLILWPVFLLITIIIKITSPGPATVALVRIRKNRTFKLYKFRSMVVNAHEMKKELMNKNERNDGPLFKMRNDPRITPFGRFLRRSRLDELPQLWNVIKGDMSLVGPRPHEPEEVSKYSKHQRKLLAITPGITGLAQVRGASDLQFEEEVRLDTYYIENWSLFLDIEILLRTIIVVLTGRGAA